MATIRDIARLSGYSVTTVSRVLNNHPYVKPEKRTKILKIIKELDYIPNAKARHLSSGKSNHIGVMLPNTALPYYEKITAGIFRAAFTAGYKVTLLPTNYDPEVELHYLDELASKAFDGMIIASKRSPFSLIDRYQKYAPIVCCEDTGAFSIPSVSTNRVHSYLDVFSKLKKSGYTHVAITVARKESVSASSRELIASYEKIFGSLPKNYIYRGSLTFEDGIEAGNYFAQFDELEVILANGDEIAAGILQTIHSEKVVVIGEENLLSSRLLHFSTIDHHLEECGEAAFHLLFSPEKQSVSIPYRFIERR